MGLPSMFPKCPMSRLPGPGIHAPLGGNWCVHVKKALHRGAWIPDQGTYTCSCYLGYTGAGTHDDPCIDEDECAVGKHNCLPAVARCVNGEGSFTCECTTGVGDGVTSCSVASVCNPNPCRDPEEKCTIIGSTWQCDCADGFALDLNGVCNNEDECSKGTHNCNPNGATPAECTDTIGSFTCSCPVGYVMDPLSSKCEDINECLQPGFRICLVLVPQLNAYRPKYFLVYFEPKIRQYSG